MLLREAGIPFTLVPQEADESKCDWGLPLCQLVASIARFKMDHVTLQAGSDGDVLFVLTADTLSQDADGTIQGKPTSREDAIQKIKRARDGSRLCTGFCLDKRVWRDGAWQVDRRIEKAVETRYHFIVPDEWLDTYITHAPSMTSSNAIAVEGFGGQFLHEVRGSYTAIVGMPMYELRSALDELGFFSR